MKFRFLLMGLLVIFSSVGSYAQDYLRFSPQTVKLLKNTWGGGNAKLKLFIISENIDGGESELSVTRKKPLNVPLKKEVFLGKKTGLSIPIDSKSVNIYILAVNQEENSAIASLAVAAIGSVAERKSIKFYKKYGKSNFFSWGFGFAVSEAVEYTLEELQEYLESNTIGMIKIRLDPYTIPSNKAILKTAIGEDKNIRLNYEIRLEDNGNSSSTQSNSTTKWITPSNSVCKNNGGKVDSDGCQAEWSNAKDICRGSGGSLPTIDELKKVATDCGGTPIKLGNKSWSNIFHKNKNKVSYQSCYKNKGFNLGAYWSLSTSRNYKNRMYILGFNTSGINAHSTDSNRYVRCIRVGQ